jgi:hypothetical protein
MNYPKQPIARAKGFFCIAVLLLFLHPFSSQSQDILEKRNGERLEVKVEEVGSSEVKYRLFNFQTGPMYIVAVKDIAQLKYANGMVENFGRTPAKAAPEQVAETPAASEIDYFVLPFSPNRNIISFNSVGLILSQIELDYRRLLKDGRLAFSFPLAYSYERRTFNNHNRSLLWGAGCDIMFYVTGQRALSYFLGVGQEVGQIEERRTFDLYEPNPNYYNQFNRVGTREEFVPFNTYSIYFTNGIEVIPYKWFSFQVGFKLGVRRVYVDDGYFNGSYYLNSESEIDAFFRGDVRMNLRF